MKEIERTEAGKSFDNYLYDIGLDTIGQEVAKNFINDNYQNNDNLFNSISQFYNIENPLKEKERRPFDYEYVIIDGIEIPCGLNVISCEF